MFAEIPQMTQQTCQNLYPWSWNWRRQWENETEMYKDGIVT